MQLESPANMTQYISDLRACRVRELEEKRVNREMAHIRQKFKDGNLDGYQKKKYLSKVVFTYILGYKVDIGHMEAVNLISSNKYSEKQIVSALSARVGARSRADGSTGLPRHHAAHARELGARASGHQLDPQGPRGQQ
jgi:hypothetical protein